ncbi:MAG: dihydrodipicolinate synthase family protein, partial [Gammaproteobacteria bacterium]|nr:dihydrodipicolinate synthase family protein [Gammaproteobacteria bacterium]
TEIIGYNIPQATGVSISADLLDRLNQLEHFNYIKDSAGDMTTLQEFLARGHKVLNGCDPNTVFAFIAGAQGCIWGAANYMPRESVQLYDLVRENDISGAMELWSRMIPSLLDIWRGNYIPKIKAACRQRGFDGGGVRAPLRAISADEERTLAGCLAALG